MSHGVEHCPTCLVVPMRPFTNGWGGAFLTCLECGYSDPIRRQSDPFPSELIPSTRGVRYKVQTPGRNKFRIGLGRGKKKPAGCIARSVATRQKTHNQGAA